MKQMTFEKQELGKASEITMEEFVRVMVKSMFDNDTIGSVLRVTLNGDHTSAPVVEIELRLRSINGQEIKLEEVH